jgi:acyl carrier protein
MHDLPPLRALTAAGHRCEGVGRVAEDIRQLQVWFPLLLRTEFFSASHSLIVNYVSMKHGCSGDRSHLSIRGSGMTRVAILAEVYKAIQRTNEVRLPDDQIACKEDAYLYGSGGGLDSLGLVSVIMDVEEAIGTETGLPIILADERAMSRMRNPFRTAGTLADYILERLMGG